MSLAILFITIALGIGWNVGVARADIVPEGTPECNCIDGFSKRERAFSDGTPSRRDIVV